MKKFEAQTLEEAYAAAAKEFSCSVTELDIQIVQNPSRGFLGFGRKNAVIVAICKKQAQRQKKENNKPDVQETGLAKKPNRKSAGKDTATKLSESDIRQPLKESVPDTASAAAVNEPEKRVPDSTAKQAKPQKKQHRGFGNEDIFGNFYDETIDINSVVSEVEKEINKLFASACFRIEPVRVFALDDETVQIEFKGEDAALLIGKEGYRYKAMAYLLYNWIHGKYGYKIRLEIAEFLQNQEAMMDSYLQPIIERVESDGRAQTKILDGILVQIALQKLRERYPEKYVAVRTNKEGGRYVIVNEFMERR